MDLQNPWKSQGKIPSVGQFVEASAHQLYYEWMFEELGWLELLSLIELDIKFGYGDSKWHSFEVATPTEIKDISFRNAVSVYPINDTKSRPSVKAADILLILQTSNIERYRPQHSNAKLLLIFCITMPTNNGKVSCIP